MGSCRSRSSCDAGAGWLTFLLLGGSESRAIQAHYKTDREFQASVNRYVHDFEAMLRRVLTDREGAILGVTLLSSDMGKLYVALSQAIERRR